MTPVSSPPLPTRAAVAVAPARAHAGAGASSRAGRTFQAAGPYTPSTVLALRAGIVAEWIRRVERAEAAYAQRHRRLGRRPGKGGTRAQAAFEGLLSAVGGLRVAWRLFRRRAATGHAVLVRGRSVRRGHRDVLLVASEARLLQRA